MEVGRLLTTLNAPLYVHTHSSSLTADVTRPAALRSADGGNKWDSDDWGNQHGTAGGKCGQVTRKLDAAALSDDVLMGPATLALFLDHFSCIYQHHIIPRAPRGALCLITMLSGY